MYIYSALVGFLGTIVQSVHGYVQDKELCVFYIHVTMHLNRFLFK